MLQLQLQLLLLLLLPKPAHAMALRVTPSQSLAGIPTDADVEVTISNVAIEFYGDSSPSRPPARETYNTPDRPGWTLIGLDLTFSLSVLAAMPNCPWAVRIGH